MANLDQKAAWRVGKQTTAEGTTAEIAFLVRSPTRRVFVSHAGARDRTNGDGTARVYIRSAGALYPLLSLTLTSANTWYSDKVQAWVYEGEELVFAFSDVTTSDTLDAAACGTQEFET
jgi:hypothetical protein